MIKNFFIYFSFILLGIILQTNIFPDVLFVKYVPDLLLIVSIAGALKFHPRDASLIAFFCGLISDFASGLVVGPQAAGNLLACVLTQAFSKNVYANRFLSVALICAGAVVVKQITANLMINIFAPRDQLAYRFDHLIGTLPFEVLATALIAPFFIKILTKKVVTSY